MGGIELGPDATRLQAWPTRARIAGMMLAKRCLGIVKNRVIYECLVQNRSEQFGPDQIQGEVAAENGGAGRRLFTWAGGHGLRRGPLPDAFFCQLTPGTSLGTLENVPAAEPGPLLGVEPIVLEAGPTR